MSPIIKKKGEKFTLPSKYLLFILTILCTLLMTVTFTTSWISEPLTSFAGSVIVPFQEGISRVGTVIYDRVEEFASVQSLIAENAQLKEQVDQLTNDNIALQQDKFELNSLRELYQLSDEYSDYATVGARIIAKDAGNWYHSFTIGKGSDDGLAVNMNVIAGSGLVGRITSVGTNWAKVSTIVNDDHSVSGMVLSSADNLIVTGNLETYKDGLIEFSKLVDNQNKVVEGDKIVTSDISDNYLPGILIGYITTINTDPNNLTKSGYITPVVDFSHLREVLVITQLKQSADSE